jgi:hypothetical protein
MNRSLLLIVFIFLSVTAFSQQQASDFIVVKKKNNRTVKTYFPGLPITLEMVNTAWVDGYITAIRNDTIFVKEYDIRSVPTIWGVNMLDTAGSFIVAVYYRDIKRILVEKKTKAFSYITDGTILMIGGIGYALLNVVNGSYLNEPITSKDNIKSLGIALGVAGAGFAMKKITKSARKKQLIEYVRMNDIKKQLRGF